MRRKNNQGFTLLEVVIGVSILTGALLGVLTVFNYLLKANRNLTQISQATFLAEEGVEVGRFFRDQGWANLGDWSSDTSYYLVSSGGGSTWSTSTTPTLIDGLFDRQITVSAVKRDSSTHEIVTSGGSTDANTRFVTVTVAWWNGSATSTQSLSAYLTKIF